MPDKIKEVYESTKDIGLFLDEKDFRDLVSRDPKGVFDIYSKDKNYKDFFLDYNDFENTLGLKKKVQLASGETSFSKSFTATLSTGEPTLSTASQSPLKPQKSTSLSESIGKAKTDKIGQVPQNLKYVADAIKADKNNNTLSFKPDLTIPWDKAPAGSEIKKEDKNADYLRVKQQALPENKPFVDYETDRAFKSLPAIAQTALNKDNNLKQKFLIHLKDNPEIGAKIQAWSKNKDATGQSIVYGEVSKFLGDEIKPYIPKLEALEKSGVGKQLQAAQDFYANFNTAIDDLKTKKTKLEFYQNNFIESKGYKDIVDESKTLNSKVKDFNIDAWKADNEKLLANIEQTKAEVQKYVVNDAVPREYQDAYARAYGEYEYAVNIYNEHANIPELKEYNNDIKSLESLKIESDDLLKEFSGNSAYKKAKEDYEASLARVESMKPQAEEFKAQQPIFNDYIQTAKTVSNLVDKLELAGKGFPAPISMQETRERITKLYNDGYMNEATLRNWAGVLESLPKAVNSILAGVGSTLSALTFGQAGEYNAYDKMADYYDGLNRYNTTILPMMESYRELNDKSTKWDLAALGYQGLQQIGNMAVFATLGSLGKGTMIITGYMMSRKERENEADEAGLTGIQKEAYVSTLSTLEGISELVMPDNQIFTKELKNMLLKDAVLAQTKGINWFRKQAFLRIKENTVKEIGEELIVNVGEFLQKVAVNYNNGNVFDVDKYIGFNSWIETAAITAPLAILGSSYSEINIPKMELEQARFQAARNLTKSREILDEMVDNGNMTTEKADSEYKKIVNYAAVQSVMPKDISPAKAVEVAPLIIENKKLEILAESGIDEVFKKQINEQIKQNVAKAEEILSRPEEVELINNEDLEVGLTEAELLRPEEEKESGRKFYQGREFMDATGLKPDYYTQEEVDAAIKAKASKMPEEIANLKDDETITVRVNDINEVPEQFRDRVKEGEIKGTTQKSFLGLFGYGKKTDISKKTYSYQITGEEAKNQWLEQNKENIPVEAAPVVEGQKTENELKVEELSKSKASEPSKSDKNYQEAQEVSSIVSKENPDASVLIQPKGDNLSLTAVYVGKEKRGEGIGTKVLESVKKQADRLGKKVVLDATNELDSETDLERLGNFYEKNGFKKVGENKYEYEPKAKVSSRDIGSRADTGGTKKSDISTDINKGQPSKKFDSTEEAVSESQAETLPKEQESKAKPVQEVPANIQDIADRLDENPTKVQNIYNKYGDKTKDISEITQEDYDKAVKARETSKSKIKMAAIQSKLRQENLSEMEKKAEAKVLKMLKEKDYNQVKEVEDFMKLLPDLQKALLKSGEIKTIDCKWGK